MVISNESNFAESNSINPNQECANSQNEYLEKFLNSYSNEFNNVWNASMIIDYIVELAQIGNNGEIYLNQIDIEEDSPYGIKMRRLNSVLKFYKKIISYSIRIDNTQPTFVKLLSKERDSNKINEIKSLIRKLSSCEESEYVISNIEQSDANFYIDISSYFNELLKHYIKLMKIKDVFSGILECSKSWYCILESIKMIYSNNFEETLKDMKRLIILLMGNDYDKSVSEKELVDKYNYPNITDRQLEEIEIEWA